MKKMVFLLPALLLLGIAGGKAQVRIGDMNNPTPGAVLDLNNPLTGGSYRGGLLLPKVALTDFTDITVDIPSAKGHEAELEGLIVYNTTKGLEGIYIWNGSNKWDVLWAKSE
jgi:hypothetical protein